MPTNFIFNDTYAPTPAPKVRPQAAIVPPAPKVRPQAAIVPPAPQVRPQADFIFNDTYAPRSLATQAAQAPVAQATPQTPQAPQPSIYDDVLRRTVGAGNALVKGITFGASDEIVSGVKTAGALLTGDDRPIGEIFNAQMQAEEAHAKAFKESNGGLALGAEIAGSILSPINKAFAAIKLGKTMAGTFATMATQGAAAGSTYVYLDSNGSPTERLANATSVAVPSAIFGVVGGKVINVSANTFKKVYARLSTKKAAINTTATLKEARNAAYDLVSNSDLTFSKANTAKANTSFATDVKKSLDYDKNSALQKSVLGNMTALVKVAGSKQGLSLGQLDKAQQALWRKHKTAVRTGNASDQRVAKQAINTINDLIDKHPNTGELMQVARHTNKQYKKAETFDKIVGDIALDAQYKNATSVDQLKAGVAKILKDPKQSKFYDKEELARFREFVADNGTYSEQMLRKLGTMAPTTALHGLLYVGIGGGAGAAGSTTASVLSAVIPATAHAAKGLAKGKQGSRNAEFITEMQGNARPANVGTAANGGMLTGTAASNYQQEQDRLNEIRRRQRSAAR